MAETEQLARRLSTAVSRAISEALDSSDGTTEESNWCGLRVARPGSRQVSSVASKKNTTSWIAELKDSAKSVLSPIAVFAVAIMALVIFNLLVSGVDLEFPRYGALLLSAVIFGISMLLAGMASPYYLGSGETATSLAAAAEISFSKMWVLGSQILLPVLFYYADFVSDIILIRRFWHSGHSAYAVLNSLAIAAGLVSSMFSASTTADRDALSLLLILFHVNPLLVAAQAIFLFCLARVATGNDPRYQSLQSYFHSEKCKSQLARSTLGEAFAEALLSMFIQTYALMTHTLAWNFLSFLSLVLSLISIVKSFSLLDMYPHVSREINGQPILVGLVKPEKTAFQLAVVYRLVEVSSQVLFFPLFQVVVDEFEFFGLRYSGVVLWSCDCLVQAVLVMKYTNWKPTKLMFAIPNTIGTYEPVLLRGSASRAFLSTPAALHVLTHLGELVLVLVYLFHFRASDVYKLWESHAWTRFVLRYYAVCNVARYILFFFLQRYCACRVDDVAPCVRDILTEKAKENADDVDLDIPLDIAMAALSPGSGTGLDAEKFCKEIAAIALKSSYVAGIMCQVVARREVHRINENAESSMIRAGKAVLDAMQQHAMVPEVQKAGSRALFQLASGSASNKKNLYQKDAVNILLKSVENHREDRNLRSAVLFALDVLAGDEEIRRHLAELALQEARVGPQDLLTWVLESLGKGSGPRSDECRKDRLLQFAACGFIGQIAFNDEKMQLKLIEAGALVLLLQSMRKHREDRDVQRAACLALRRLSPLRVQRLRSLGLQEVVSKAMDTHPGHAALQREAWKLLETLEQASRC